jgi:hypothetical protein
VPSEVHPKRAVGAFVPTREYGYAEREGEQLAIDASFLESHPDSETVLKELEMEHASQLDDGHCHCEICREL